MKPKKKPSIRDFFAPIPRRPQVHESASHAPQPQDASSTRPASATLSDTIHVRRGPTPPRVAPSTARFKHNASTAPPTNIHAPSPDAQPPTTSQTSVNSGVSKRIVSNGEHIVLNSDSDTDSLPELDFGGLATNFKTATPITRPKRATEYDDDGLRKPEKRVKSKTQKFDQVIQTAQQSRELERIISEHKANLETSLEEPPAPAFIFNEDALGQAVEDDDDPEKAHRLFLAMQRTNATHVENVFHFFDNPQTPLTTRSSFPTHSLPEHRWTTTFRDASTRNQTFLTGFAHQVFRLRDLPQELASWMLDEICLNRSDALNSRYLEILEEHNQHLRNLLDRPRLDAIFQVLGANLRDLDSSAQFGPSFFSHSANAPLLPPPLKSVLKLLERSAPWLRTKARSHAFYLLCHTGLDDRIITDADMLSAVQQAMEAIICNFVDNRKLIQGVGIPQQKDEPQFLIASQLSDIVPQLLLRITHPLLQRNLVCALPANSPLTAYFRRHLAFSFLFQPNVFDVALTDPQLPALVHEHLETSPCFRIGKKTDYHFFAARMALLDIAIGPGLLTVPYQPLVSPAPSQAGSSPILAPCPASDEIKEFNVEVDALAQHIKLLGNSISEAGAVTDLTILDAKDCVERLCSRLEHAVRVGGKKTYNVFGNEDAEKQLKVTDIFRKVAKARRTATAHGIFDEDDELTDDNVAVAAQIEAETAT